MIIQGTASVVNGDATVIFTGPVLSALSVLESAFVVIEGDTYFLGSLTNTTTFELTRPYEGTTGSGKDCEINSLTTEQTQIATLNKKTADLLEQFSLLDANTQGLFYYKIAASGAVDPGPGKISFNTDTVTARTKLYIDDLDANYPNRLVKALISTWTIGTILIIRSLESNAYASYKLTANPTGTTGFQSIDIIYVSSDGIIGNQEAVSIAWFAIGQGLQIDAAGTFANRTTYNASPAGFTYLSTNGNGTSILGAGLYRKNTATSGDWSTLAPLQGTAGNNGWSPRFAVATDVNRRVLQLVEYIGGTGTAPTTGVGQYLTAAGFTSNISLAVDVRGSQGIQGTAGTNGTNGTDGTNGIDGLSAYDLAVSHGYSGTEADWLLSLVGPRGADGTDAGVFLIWDVGTSDANPGSGIIRGSDPDLIIATQLFVSKFNRAGDDISIFLLNLAASTSNGRKGIINLKHSGGNGQILYDLVSVTDATGYVKLTVSNGSGVSNFLDNDLISLEFSPTGNKGLDGLGAGNVIGDLTSVANHFPFYTDSSGTAIADSGVGVADFLLKNNNGSDFSNKNVTLDNLHLNGADIASASTVDLESATGYFVEVTGTVATTAITLANGHKRLVRAGAAWPLTQGTNLQIQGGISYTCSAGDLILFVADGVVIRSTIFPVSGQPVARTSIAKGGTNATTANTALDNLHLNGADIASATTVNLEASTGAFVEVTGTVATTAITLSDGHQRLVRAGGAWPLIHGTNLQLPGANNYTCVIGDLILFQADGAVIRAIIFPISGKRVTPKVSFSANKNSVSQSSIPASTSTKITFDTEAWDVGGYYDAVNSRWAPPIGIYRISAVIYITAGLVDQAAHELYINKNGVLYKYLNQVSLSGTIGPILGGSILINQTIATDYYELFYRAGGAGAKTIDGNSANTFFEGEEI